VDIRLRTFAMWIAPTYGRVLIVGLFLGLVGTVVLGDVLAGRFYEGERIRGPFELETGG
jgi:hypothetical protein